MNQPALYQTIQLNTNLSIDQQISLSILQMNYMELHTFLMNEVQSNPALEGELPSTSAITPISLLEDMSSHYKKEVSLREELLFQLYTIKQVPDRMLCEYIIYCINEKGYLTQTIQEICQQFEISRELVDEAVELIQSFEPAGVGAQDLRECFILQLSRWYKEDLQTKTLVTECLPDLLNHRLELVMQKTSCTLEQVQDAMRCIKKLNPIPGNGWAEEELTNFSMPDIELIDKEDGFEIKILKQGLENIILNPYYVENLNTFGKQAKVFVKRYLKQAKTILKSIDDRQATLYKIAKIITDKQREHLKLGAPLVTLRLSDIAQQLGIHESTVSRGISGKSLLYHGLSFQLSSLLSQGVSNGVSVDSIKQRLASIIQRENRQAPFTDPELMNELSRYGLHISRRTVSKYRQELGILSAKQRKVWNEGGS